MNRFIFFLIIPFICIASFAFVNNYQYTSEPVTDSLQVKLDTIVDASGIPDYYKAQISTPICEADKCYAVEIIFYWDLIGRFVSYDTIPGAGLTKLDHIPFQPQDYHKLLEILVNENSVLASYTKEGLVQDNRVSEIDGFTGATIKEIKESVIEGAVYSCFTLWHIAHGSISEKLKTITKDLFDKDLVRKLVSKDDPVISYYLIDHFSDEDYMKYMPEVEYMIESGEGYFAKNAIEKLPSIFLADDSIQSFFSSNFTQLNYFAQVALLERLQEVELSISFADTLKNQLEERDSYKNELIKQLLDKAVE